MSARTASALVVERYSSLTFASSARADHLELGHAEQARDHRAGEVDALHAVERRAAMRAEQDAAAHLDVVAGDAERVEPPRQVEDADQHEQRRRARRAARRGTRLLRDDAVDRVAGSPSSSTSASMSGASHGRNRYDEPVAQVGDDDADDHDEEQPAAEQRGQRMQPMPLAVAQRRAHARCGGGRAGRRPAAGGSGRRPGGGCGSQAGPAASRRRRRGCRAASRPPPASSPGIDDAGGGGGGDELELGDAEAAVERAVGDVDELHAPVGHRDHALPQDAAAEDEVVVAQLVADRARLARQ